MRQDVTTSLKEPNLDFLESKPSISQLPKTCEEIAEKIKTSSPDEIYELANIYYKEIFYDQAFFLYKIAAGKMHIEAINRLGDCYYFGRGTSEDKVQAVKCYQHTAKQDSLYGKYKLGVCSYYGQGIPKNYQDALQYFGSIAESQHEKAPDAKYRIGYIYYSGYGVRADLPKAFSYFKSAADQGHSDAQYMTGWMIYYGKGGIGKDKKLGGSYIIKSAKQCDADALLWLAWCCLYNGPKVRPMMLKGIWCYILAERLGEANATERLSAILRSPQIIQSTFYNTQQFNNEIRTFRDTVQESVVTKQLLFAQTKKSIDMGVINKEVVTSYLDRAVPVESDHLNFGSEGIFCRLI